MRIIDLTSPIQAVQEGAPTVSPYIVPLTLRGEKYRGACYRLALNGMSGTYVDFPGHIAEFDDGLDAGNCPIENLFMLDTTVIHLRRDAAVREVTADELEAAGIGFKGEVLIVHALGEKSWSDFDVAAIPYFGPSAIQWIVGRRPKIFVSDIYEKRPDQQGIFVELFRNHISCVCCPANLDQIRETYPKSCIAPLKLDQVKQAPCRLVVVEQD